MKTDDLIEALVQDVSRPRWSTAQRILGAIVVGALMAGALFVYALGVRPDFGSAIETGRFVFKWALSVICLVCAWRACLELTRPEVRWSDVAGWIAVPPMLLAAAVVYELMAMPSGRWYELAVGRYASTCLSAIPLLSIVPLAALLIALRAGAPRSPPRPSPAPTPPRRQPARCHLAPRTRPRGSRPRRRRRHDLEHDSRRPQQRLPTAAPRSKDDRTTRRGAHHTSSPVSSERASSRS
ncbi:MAG: DUF1109 domain-containing protein [Sphingomonadales bacterium]|nr:DUF1109 domain-containing protein [Sphingomonadales bacterium]